MSEEKTPEQSMVDCMKTQLRVVTIMITKLNNTINASGKGLLTHPLPVFASAYRLVKDLESVVAIIKKERSLFEGDLQEQMIEEGVQSAKTAFGTVYFHHQLWASPEQDLGATVPERQEAMCSVLDELGLDYLFHRNANTTSLSAYVRELIKDAETEKKSKSGETVDQDILTAFRKGTKGVINIEERSSLRVRKS